VTLTPREFALLEYLMSNAGESLAKSEILNAVWVAFDGDPNIVESTWVTCVERLT